MSLDARLAIRRLGFAVKVAGRPDLKDHDGRRWQNEPHLRVSLTYLDRIFDYLSEHGIRMYRISSDIAPYITHPEMPQFHGQIEECREELAKLGEKARAIGLRLSMHPAQYIVLNSPRERVAEASIRDFAYHAAFLDALGSGLEAKIVTHVGGVYGDRNAAAERFVERYLVLPDAVRRRLVLENDEVSWPAADVLAIHERTGVPLVFDNLHHQVNNPTGRDAAETMRAFIATWPEGQTPKIHFSSQRTTDRVLVRKDRLSGARTATSAPPKPGQHADFVDAEEFIALVGSGGELAFDIMLEAKQKELALLRLRSELADAGMSDLAW